MGFIPELAIASENAALYIVGELSSRNWNICAHATTKYGSQHTVKQPIISSTICLGNRNK